MADVPPAFEAYAVTPVFATALARVEVDRHGIAHLAFMVEQSNVTDGSTERVLCARLVLPAAVLDGIAGRLLRASHDVDEAPEPSPLAIPIGRA